MVKNIGQFDRLIRVLIAVTILILIITGQLTGILAIFFGILAVVFAGTAFIGTCPIYLMFKISSRRKTVN
jgi:hypothetical protein